ncbi:MAG: WecB/TagA/CpsF family glycosyltransferase [Lachnospiraceae bacterium]|nr:WecB/TagA/CpsF family glycosyltransferase [Lachnospiraceae bacterium]
MEERVQLPGSVIDILSTKDAIDSTQQFIKETGSHVVYLVNSETLLLLQKNTEDQYLVEESELILPGTASVSASIDQVLGHRRDSFFLESYMDAVFDYCIENGLEMLIVAEDEDKFISMQENIHEKRPLMTLSGIYITQQAESMSHIVNEINSVAPDVLMIALKEEKQLELLKEYRNQMNAGMILVAGNILYNQAVSESQVPETIQKFRIDSLYKWFRVGGRLRAGFANLIVKFQIKKSGKDEKMD